MKRVQDPHDKHINSEFNEHVKRPIDDIPLVDFAESDDEHPFGILIENEPTPPKIDKVSLSNFLCTSRVMGNESGDES